MWCRVRGRKQSLFVTVCHGKYKMLKRKNVTFTCTYSWSTSTLRKFAECILFCFVLIFLCVSVFFLFIFFFRQTALHACTRFYTLMCVRVFTDDCKSTNHSAITRNDDKASLKQQSNKRWQVVKWTFLKMMPKEKYACRLSFEAAESSISAGFVAAVFFSCCSRGQQQ